MKAVVLVGGFGTRLRPLTTATPKQMLPILHRPMIEHVIEHLAEHGVTEAVLSMGFRPDVFTDAYPDGICAGVRLHYAIEPEPLDTAGAIRFAALDAGIDERFVVVNGDILTDLDIAELVRFHDDHGGEGTISLHEVEDPSAFGVVPTEPDGRVIAFVEKPPRDEAPTNLINAGTYVFEPAVLDRIADGRRVSVEREVFPAMVDDRVLYAMAGETYWIDTGTHRKYLSSQMDLLDGVRGPADDGVHASAEIDETARVERSVIGAGVRVGAGSVVTNSVVLPGAIIADDVRIDDSIIGPAARVSDRSLVTDLTVVGGGGEIAAGAEASAVIVDVDAVFEGETVEADA